MLKPDYKWPRLLDFAERKRQQSIPKAVLAAFLSMRGMINLGYAGPKKGGLAKVCLTIFVHLLIQSATKRRRRGAPGVQR